VSIELQYMPGHFIILKRLHLFFCEAANCLYELILQTEYGVLLKNIGLHTKQSIFTPESFCTLIGAIRMYNA
jgi:hypothetical protein